MTDWLTLERRFRDLSKFLAHMRLDIQTGSAGEYRTLKGVSSRGPKVQEFRSTAALAGKTLVGVFDDIADPSSNSDELEQAWYAALETIMSQRIENLTVAWQVADDGEKQPIYSSTIRNAAGVSADLCLVLHREKPVQHEKAETGMEMNIFSGQFGFLNTGVLQNVNSIRVNVENLQREGEEEMAEAFGKITEAIGNSALDDETKEEALEQVEALAEQAALPEESRSSRGVIKAVFAALGDTMSAGGGLAEIWSTWGSAISKFFGLSQ